MTIPIVRALVESHGNNFLDKDVLPKTIGGREYLEINLCLDTGANIVCAQSMFLKSSNFPRLPDKTLTVVTVFGKERQTFARSKLKIRKTNNKNENLCALNIPEIGTEKQLDSEFIAHILEHFPFQFNPQVIDKLDTTSFGKINVLIGSNLSQYFKYPISSEALGLPTSTSTSSRLHLPQRFRCLVILTSILIW